MSASGSSESGRADQLYRELNHRQDELVAQGVADHLLRRERKRAQSRDRCRTGADTWQDVAGV